MKEKRFSVSTFNLCNLNSPGKPIYTDENGIDQATYNKKIEWTSQQLSLINSDVVGFQELWDDKPLRDIVSKIQSQIEYDIIVPPNSNGKSIFCAAIVRKGFLVNTPNWVDKFPEKFILSSSGDDKQTPELDIKIKGFSRPVLHFEIQPNNDSSVINIYVCHLKSKAPTKVFNENWYKKNSDFYSKHSNCIGSTISTIRRSAEAAALRFILNEQMKKNDTPVIVMGDMNDSTYSNTANIITEQPNYLFGDSVGGGDTALYSTQTLQEYRDTRDVLYTYNHQGIKDSLDQIFVSQELYDRSKKRIWLFEKMVSYNDHLNDDNHNSDGTSDHGIIKAIFSYKPRKA